MKKRCLLGMLVCMLTLTGCGNGVQKAAPQWVFRYAENQTEDYPTTLAGKFFAQRVAELTKGRIEIVVYANEALGDEKSVIEQMQFSGVDFARLNISPLAEVDERYYVLQLPYLYDSLEHMWRVLDGELGQQYLNMAQDIDLYGLAWVDAGARSFYTRTPVYSLQDMQGMRIRVQENKLMQRLVEVLGAYPQRLRYGEVLSALQTGEIDSAENNIPSYWSMGHYMIAKYYFVDEHTRIPEMIVASRTTMALLSEQDQAAIKLAAKEAAEYQRALWLEYEAQAKERVIESGCVMIRLTDENRRAFKEATAVLYDEFAKDSKDVIEKIRILGD